MLHTAKYQPNPFDHNPERINCTRMHNGHQASRLAHYQQEDRNVSIRDNGDKVELSIDVPGVKRKNLNVSVDDHVLTISGTRGEHSFSRQYKLDNTVDVENLTANLEDGVLTIRAPKVEESGSVMIPITEEASSDVTEKVTNVDKEIAVETVAENDDDNYIDAYGWKSER